MLRRALKRVLATDGTHLFKQLSAVPDTVARPEGLDFHNPPSSTCESAVNPAMLPERQGRGKPCPDDIAQ
jgi:hypothetical protein